MAARLGQAFVATAPEGFRGRVQIHRTPTGVSYAILADGSRFAVLPLTASPSAMDGRSGVISRDSKGALVIRRDLDRGLGT
jgi:hypothetical protein